MLSDGGLLEIGKDMENVTSHEKVFKTDQQTTRECRLSEEIDEDFEKEQQSLCENLLQQKQEQTEHDFIMMDDNKPDPILDETELMNVSINTSNILINRSHYACIQHNGVDIAVQTEPSVPGQSTLQINKRGHTNEIKSACDVFCLFGVYLLKLPEKLFKLFAKNC